MFWINNFWSIEANLTKRFGWSYYDFEMVKPIFLGTIFEFESVITRAATKASSSHIRLLLICSRVWILCANVVDIRSVHIRSRIKIQRNPIHLLCLLHRTHPPFSTILKRVRVPSLIAIEHLGLTNHRKLTCLSRHLLLALPYRGQWRKFTAASSSHRWSTISVWEIVSTAHRTTVHWRSRPSFRLKSAASCLASRLRWHFLQCVGFKAAVCRAKGIGVLLAVVAWRDTFFGSASPVIEVTSGPNLRLMLVAALWWALAESCGTLVWVGPWPAAISTVQSCKRSGPSGSFATLLVLQRVKILAILLSDNLAIQLFQLFALHDDLLSVFLASLNVVTSQV